MTPDLKISNPKRNGNTNGVASWYPYYAGFSPEFVKNLIISANLNEDSCVADPWNGAGTTTTVANSLGYMSRGVDLNPVMIIAAKACLLSRTELPSVMPLLNDILRKSLRIKINEYSDTASSVDPLSTWFKPMTTSFIRKLERSVYRLLVDISKYRTFNHFNIDYYSCITCLFYVGLFRLIRKLIIPFLTSNPTWVKKAKGEDEKLEFPLKVITHLYNNIIVDMVKEYSLSGTLIKSTSKQSDFFVAPSNVIPWGESSVDLLITSPPYCTRIDYAVATMPELSIINFSKKDFDLLRTQLIGNTTITKDFILELEEWGPTCNKFIDAVHNHASSASKTYYYKNHLQYFNGIYQSLRDIVRVLKDEASCVFVIQDSFYKNLHNDLPKVYEEMGYNCGLRLVRRKDFPTRRTMAGINPITKQYRTNIFATESVLCFQKL